MHALNQPAMQAESSNSNADQQLFMTSDPRSATHPHMREHLQPYEYPHAQNSKVPQVPAISQYGLSPDVIAAIARALEQNNPIASGSQQPTRKYFSKAITNATSELPMPVIKELKAGFKNYIPLALCTHKACLYATRYTDPFDTEIGWTEKGEMRLKQKSMTAAKDHYLTTDDFTEIRENFIRGMRKYLVLNDLDGEVGSGQLRASECVDMFAEFFSIIAARPDFTQDWASYRGYIIESYTSWVGRRDDYYGLIFDEQLFYKHKITHLVPVLMEQLRQPPAGGSGRGGAGVRGRGRGLPVAGSLYTNRGGFHTQPFPSSFQSQQASNGFRCYLCGGSHSHKEHQGLATRLVLNEQGKWVDKSLGNKIVCISFNVSSIGCKRGAVCTYSHSCSLCGELSHGSAKCGA